MGDAFVIGAAASAATPAPEQPNLGALPKDLVRFDNRLRFDNQGSSHENPLGAAPGHLLVVCDAYDSWCWPRHGVRLGQRQAISDATQEHIPRASCSISATRHSSPRCPPPASWLSSRLLVNSTGRGDCAHGCAAGGSGRAAAGPGARRAALPAGPRPDAACADHVRGRCRRARCHHSRLLRARRPMTRHRECLSPALCNIDAAQQAH